MQYPVQMDPAIEPKCTEPYYRKETLTPTNQAQENRAILHQTSITY